MVEQTLNITAAALIPQDLKRGQQLICYQVCIGSQLHTLTPVSFTCRKQLGWRGLVATTKMCHLVAVENTANLRQTFLAFTGIMRFILELWLLTMR